VPDHGAAITQCQYKNADVLRPYCGPKDHFDILQSAGYPLVPFSNRIENGRFEWEGQQVNLAQTHPDISHPIHGYGWLGKWDVVRQTESMAQLRFDYPGDEWPWAFTAEQSFEISEQGLMHRLSITNTSNALMPVGLGFHPFFPNAQTACLTFETQKVWNAGHDGLPTELSAIPEEWNFSKGRAIAGTQIDHCFTDVSAQAQIDYESGLTIALTASETLGHAVLYTASGDGSFCYEPVSHMSNGVNWQNTGVDTGVRALPPGRTLSVWMRYQVSLAK